MDENRAHWVFLQEPVCGPAFEFDVPSISIENYAQSGKMSEILYNGMTDEKTICIDLSSGERGVF